MKKILKTFPFGVFSFITTWGIIGQSHPVFAQVHPTPQPPTGHPAQIPNFSAIADVRTFAVARANQRALVAYVEAGEERRSHVRGTVRLALLQEQQGNLVRVGEDRTISPPNEVGSGVAIVWDGTQGAVAYLIPRPHRLAGQNPRRSRRTAPVRINAALEDPLGRPSLSGADIVLQRIDADGNPVGSAVTVFQEHSRTYRVALAREADGWRVAWTGSLTFDDEVHGTVRSIWVSDQGVTHSVAVETGFTGDVGDVLRMISTPSNASTLVFWSALRCSAQEGQPAVPLPAAQTPRPVRPRDRHHQGEGRGQTPPNEISGPPIVCGERQLFSTEFRHDHTTGGLNTGPFLATDAFSLVTPLTSLTQGQRLSVIAPIVINENNTHNSSELLARVEVNDHGQFATPQPLTVNRSTQPGEWLSRSLVISAATSGNSVAISAVSPSHERVAWGSLPTANDATNVGLAAPGTRIYDISVTPSSTQPWMFAQTGATPGGVIGGPLMVIMGEIPSNHLAQPENPWPGDDRLRSALLRVRAARAAYNALENTYAPLSARADAATNPHLPGIASSLTRLRARWEEACNPLLERARQLVRQQGLGNDLMDLVRAQCANPLDHDPE